MPDWCSFSPGAKIERGYIKCHISNGTAGEWEISDNTLIEGGYYLYKKGKNIVKIHIKEKRRIAGKEKHSQIKIDKNVALWVFLGISFLIFVIVFIINNH